jgi:hypothetical protein
MGSPSETLVLRKAGYQRNKSRTSSICLSLILMPSLAIQSAIVVFTNHRIILSMFTPNSALNPDGAKRRRLALR